MKSFVFLLATIFTFFLNQSDSFAQKKNRWTDSLEYAAARGKKAILCGDETFYTSADQPPYVKKGTVKTPFMDILRSALEEEKSIDGAASITVEIVVNCKGEPGSLKLLKYGDTENLAELALVNALNNAIAKLPTFMPAKNEGRIVNYKQDKLKVKVKQGKITLD